MTILDSTLRRTEANRVIKLLDHPARKRIIELLGTRGSMPWKDLASELGMGTGVLYYHLDTLEGIVVRDSSRRYSLTKPGLEVYEYLKANPFVGSVKDPPLALRGSGRMRDYFEGIFVPRSLLLTLTSSNLRSILSLLFFSGAFAIALLLTKNEALIFYLTPASGALIPVGSF